MVVECLPGVCKVLGSIPNAEKKRKPQKLSVFTAYRGDSHITQVLCVHVSPVSSESARHCF